MADEIDVHEARTHLSRLLDRVAAGEPITITRAGRPIADLVPHQRRTVRFGGLRGKISADDSVFDWPDPEIERIFGRPGERMTVRTSTP